MRRSSLLCILILLSGCCADSGSTHAVFRYRECVVYNHNFYGACRGKIMRVSENEKYYAVDTKCDSGFTAGNMWVPASELYRIRTACDEATK